MSGGSAPPLRPPLVAVGALSITAQAATRMQLSVAAVRNAIHDRLQASLPAGRRRGDRITESAIQNWLRVSQRPANSTNRRDP